MPSDDMDNREVFENVFQIFAETLRVPSSDAGKQAAMDEPAIERNQKYFQNQ